MGDKSVQETDPTDFFKVSVVGRKAWSCWSRISCARDRRASGLLGHAKRSVTDCDPLCAIDAITILRRLAICVAGFEPEADTTLKTLVEMNPQGIVEKNQETTREQIDSSAFLFS
jgi:hypothetical protein